MKEPPPKLPSLIIPVTDPQTLTSTTLVPSLVPSSLSTLAPTSPFFPTHASSSSSSSTSTTSTTTIPLSSVGSSKPTTYVSGYDPVDSETGLKAFPNLNDFILNESRDPGAGIPVLSTVVSPPTLSNHELRSMYLQSIHILKLKGELGPKERWQHAIFSILRTLRALSTFRMNKPSSNTFPSSMKSPTLTTPYLPPLHSPNTRLMTRKSNVSTPMGGTGGGGSMASPSTTLLEFKLSDYTRSRGFMITTDMCKELDKPHIYYTEKSIDLIRKITERLESFQKYQPEMREKLLRCLQYCCYKPGCIIIKQGHEPKSFYFILSGTAQVYRTENNVQLTLSELQPGDSFGEVALLKNTRRSASVICKTMVEAFSVDKEDFHEVLKKTAEEDQSLKMEFLKSIPLFHDQPNPVLLRLAEVCVKQERGTNVVLVKEKEVLSDLFILRKGSVRLVKILPFWKVHFSGGGKKQFTLVPAIPSTSSVSGFLPPRFIHHQQPQPYLHLTQPKHHLKTQSAKKASTENPWLVFPRTLPKTPKEIKKKTPPVATTTLQEVGTRRDSSFPMSEHDLSKAVDPSCLERMSPSSLGSSSSSSPSSSSSSGVTTSIHGHEEPSKRSLQKKGKTKETPFSSSSSSSSSSTSTSTSSDDEDTPTNEHDPDLNSDLPHESASEQEEKEETKKPKKKEKAFLHLHPQETEPNLTTTTTTTSTHPSSIPPLHRPFPKNRGSGSPLPPSPTTPAPQLVYKLVCVGALGPGQFFGEECLQEETKGGEGGGPSGSTLSNPPSLTLPPHPLLPPPPPPPNSSSPASSLPPSSQSSSSTPNHYANTLYSSPSHLLDSFNAPSPTPPTSTSTSTSFPSSSSSSSPPPHVTSSSSSSLLTSSMTHGTGTGSTRPGSVYSVITCEPTEIFKISKVDFVKLVPMYLPPPPIWTRPKVEEENKQETEKNPWMEEGVSKMPRSLSMSSSMSMSMSMSMSFTGWMLRPFQDRYLATLRWLHWKAHVLRHLHEEVQHSKHRFHTTPMFRNEDMLKSMKAGVKRSMSKKSILHQTQPQVQTEKPPPPSSTMLSKKKKRGEKHPGNEKKKEKEKEKEKFHRPMNSKRQERKDSKETDEEEDVDEEGREKRTPTPPRSLSMSLTSSSFKMNRPSLPRKK